jgi:hypothetical protein
MRKHNRNRPGFGAINKGAAAFSESTIAKNLRRQADTDYKHMRSHGFRAAESVIGTVRNKRDVSVGSLVTQKGRSRKSSSSSSGSSSSSSRESINGFSARYIKGQRGHISLQWFYKLQPVEFSDVKGYLSNNEINHLRKAANEVFKGHINIGSLSGGSISGFSSSSKGSVPTLTQKGGYGLAKCTKKATVGGLIKQRNEVPNTDYGNTGYENYSYEPAGTVAGVATAGINVNRVEGNFATIQAGTGGLNARKAHSNVVVTKKTATLQGLWSSNKGGVKARTNEASPSRLFGKKSGIRAKQQPATPSKILSKQGM